MNRYLQSKIDNQFINLTDISQNCPLTPLPFLILSNCSTSHPAKVKDHNSPFFQPILPDRN